MSKVYPETVINIPEDMDADNANSNNNRDGLFREEKKKSSPSVCSKLPDVRNEYLYRPGVGSKLDIPRPISSSVSVANGRRLLVTGKSLNIPAQEFLEEVTKCFSRTNTVYVKKIKDISKGLLGFQVISGYEVLNANLMRICVLGLVDTVFSGFQFIIVNPFGVDAFIFKKCLCGPDSVSGPGLVAPYQLFNGRYTVINFACDKTWYQLDLGVRGTYFPYWTFPFCGSYGKGPDFKFRNGLDKSKLLARVTRYNPLDIPGTDNVMKLDFSHSLTASQRILLFSGSLYAFYYHFIPRGRYASVLSFTVQISLWLIVIAMILLFIIIP